MNCDELLSVCLKIWIKNKKVEKKTQRTKDFLVGFEPIHFQFQCDFSTQHSESSFNCVSSNRYRIIETLVIQFNSNIFTSDIFSDKQLKKLELNCKENWNFGKTIQITNCWLILFQFFRKKVKKFFNLLVFFYLNFFEFSFFYHGFAHCIISYKNGINCQKSISRGSGNQWVESKVLYMSHLFPW